MRNIQPAKIVPNPGVFWVVDVHITLNEYIRIWHAYVKAKGVSILYLPYLILPIKKERESGLLSPTLSLTNREGYHFSIALVSGPSVTTPT